MRLHNRIVKADSYTDPEMLRWPSAKRDLYRSLWALAEDSACVEDDPFGWKCAAWPSPMDAKTHSVAKFEAWRKELVSDGKAVPYVSDGGHFLFLPAMAKHEHPRNPQSPNIPLPPWVTWNQHPSDLRKGSYEVDWALYERCTTVKTDTVTVPALSCPALSCPDPNTGSQNEPALGVSRARVAGEWERIVSTPAPPGLISMCEFLPEDLLVEAIHRAAAGGKTTLGYVRATAQGLKADGWRPPPVIVSEPDAYDAL